MWEIGIDAPIVIQGNERTRSQIYKGYEQVDKEMLEGNLDPDVDKIEYFYAWFRSPATKAMMCDLIRNKMEQLGLII